MKTSPPAILSESRKSGVRSKIELLKANSTSVFYHHILLKKLLSFKMNLNYSELSNQHSGLLPTLSPIIKLWDFKINTDHPFIPWPYRCFIKEGLNPMILDSDQRCQIQLTPYNCVTVAELFNLS